jgi:hypothetical protein
MIVWGSRGDVVNLGPQETKDCLTCEKPRPFDLILQYRYGGLYWVFNFVMERKYLLLCQVCGRGWELPEKQVEPLVKHVKIPYMRRYGLATLAAVVAFLIFGIKQDAKRELRDLQPTPAPTPAPETVGAR